MKNQWNKNLAQTALQMDMATAAAEGLEQAVASLRHQIGALLAGVGVVHVLSQTVEKTGLLSKEFQTLRTTASKWVSTLGQAVAPIAQVVIPVINEGLMALVSFVDSLGKVIRALFGVQTSGTQAAQATQAVGTAATASAKAVRRSLAGFDKLNRLTASAGTTGTSGSRRSSTKETALQIPKLDAKELTVFLALKQMLLDWKGIDLTPLSRSFQGLKTALEPLGRDLFSGLAWAWYELFLPMTQWAAEKLLPAAVDVLAAAFQALGDTITACKPVLDDLWLNFLKPIGQWTGKVLLEALEYLRQKLEKVSLWMQTHNLYADELVVVLGLVLGVITLVNGAMQQFGTLGTSNIGTMGAFTGTLSAMQNPANLVLGILVALAAALALLVANWDDVAAAGRRAWQSIQTTWNNAVGWFSTHVLSPLKNGVKSMINGVIAYLNGLLSAMTTGINTVIGGVNSLQFTVPSWVPKLGGETFGFHLKKMSAVQIPYLAQGAVLPANKPFLAVVGDQHRGTNVEAPLSTIQEAVALVMEDVISSTLAGQEAVVGVLRQILEAVLGIHLDDAQVAMAAERYRRKISVVSGSY